MVGAAWWVPCCPPSLPQLHTAAWKRAPVITPGAWQVAWQVAWRPPMSWAGSGRVRGVTDLHPSLALRVAEGGVAEAADGPNSACSMWGHPVKGSDFRLPKCPQTISYGRRTRPSVFCYISLWVGCIHTKYRTGRRS
jgi:hypothetical protein